MNRLRFSGWLTTKFTVNRNASWTKMDVHVSRPIRALLFIYHRGNRSLPNFIYRGLCFYLFPTLGGLPVDGRHWWSARCTAYGRMCDRALTLWTRQASFPACQRAVYTLKAGLPAQASISITLQAVIPARLMNDSVLLTYRIFTCLRSANLSHWRNLHTCISQSKNWTISCDLCTDCVYKCKTCEVGSLRCLIQLKLCVDM